MNPDVFPEPHRFMPDRWTDATPEMEKFLVPFSKGRRMCPGKEYVWVLAWTILATCNSDHTQDIHHGTLHRLRGHFSTIQAPSIPYNVSTYRPRLLQAYLMAFNSLADFDWKAYISLHFKGRPFRALMTPRDGFVGRPAETLIVKS